MSKIIIDPYSRIWYSSYYIKGLYEVFGKKNISFSVRQFKILNRKQEKYSFDHYLAFIIVLPDKNKIKVIIDFADPPVISKNAYDWTDCYAKINFNINQTDKIYHDKIISIPPGFGIRIWNIWETSYYCCLNLLKCKFSPLVTLKIFFKDYFSQYRRSKLDDYIDTNKGNSIKPYVFMIATLWRHKNCIESTNLNRKIFIERCKLQECTFEGGFYIPQNHSEHDKYKDYALSKRYSAYSYVEKTKLSRIVFNTPSVHNCHGWKLGEFLAMGKAIISTPLSNELPENLVHGKNIHFVLNEHEIDIAIETLLNDNNYRLQLESGAKSYYVKYASPTSVIKNILEAKGININ